jgi:hypothetical protein
MTESNSATRGSCRPACIALSMDLSTLGCRDLVYIDHFTNDIQRPPLYFLVYSANVFSTNHKAYLDEVPNNQTNGEVSGALSLV